MKRIISIIIAIAVVFSFATVSQAKTDVMSGSFGDVIRTLDGVYEIVDRAIRSKLEFRSNYAEYGELAVIPETENGYVPQGFCVSEDGNTFIVSFYHSEKASVLAFVDAENGEKIKTVNLLKKNGDDFTGHAGGIAQTSGYLYIGNGNSIYRLAMEEINALSDGGSIKLEERITADVKTSFISTDGEYLYAGEFYTFTFDGDYDTDKSHHTSVSAFERSYARCCAYKLTELNASIDSQQDETSAPEFMLTLPNRVQGMARDESGRFILSTSYGRNNDSFMLVYDNVTDGDSDGCVDVKGEEIPLYYLVKSDCTDTLRLPPMLEGIDYSSGKVIGIFESGAEKYSDSAFIVNSICEFEY